MAITRGTATASSGANTTSCTVTIDAGVQADDILELVVVNRDSTANVSVTDNDTGGNAWALLTNQAADTNGSGQRWWKRATSGTAGKTITVSGATGSVSAACTPFRGCPTTGTPFGTAVSEANASGNEVQAGITTTRNGSWVLHMVACTSNDTLNPGNRSATDPTTLTESAEGTSSGGSDCSVSSASAEKATIGATGNISWSQTNGTGASSAVELLNVASLGDDSDGFVPSVYNATIAAVVLAAELATQTQTARAVAITGGDREEIPAGFVQPNLDDGYRWIPILQTEWTARSPFYDAEEWPTPPVPFLPDEDHKLPVIQWPEEPWHGPPPPVMDEWVQTPLIDGDYIPQPRWPEHWLARQAPEQGADYITPPVLDDQTRLPTPVWPDVWLSTTWRDLGADMVPQPPSFLPEEMYWQAPPPCVTAPNFVFYPPDRGEPAGEEPGIWVSDPVPGATSWAADPVDSSQDWTPDD